MSGNDESLLQIKDWQIALLQGWELEAEHGIWQIEDGKLHLATEAAGEQGVVLRSPQGWKFPDSFVLEIRLRFLSIGLMDNDTQAACLVFESGSQANGAQVTLIGDRYMVDVDRSPLQYIIYRSEPGVWYDWRFEVDGEKGQIALIRNGEYTSLHALHGERQAGFRLVLNGIATVPAIAEIGELCVSPLGNAAPPAPILNKPIDEIAPGEWPGFRRDRLNSAHSPLKGAFGDAPPQVAWSYALGGWQADALPLDLDRDGLDELVISHNGRLAAYRLDGSMMWEQSIDSPRVYGLYDLDDNGYPDLVVTAGAPAHVQVFDARTGRLRYACEHDPSYNVSGLRVAKLDPQVQGLQIVVWTQHEIGYCLGFNKGVERGEVLWTYDYKHFNFVPEIVMADMDRDGLPEVVLATYSHFLVYDGQNGHIKMETTPQLGRNYGLLIAADIDLDGYPDIVMLAEQLREHVGVVKNEAGKSLRLLWDKFYEQDYPVDDRQLRTLPGSVRDWDGDGRVEILYGLYDENEGAIWCTLLVDAVSGEIRQCLEKSYPVSMDVLEDGRPAVLLLEVDGRGERSTARGTMVGYLEPNLSGQMKLVIFGNAEARTLCTFDSKGILLRHSWWDFPLTDWAMYMDRRTPARRKAERGYYFVDAAPNGPAIVRHLIMDEAGGFLEQWRCAISEELPSGEVLDVLQGQDGARLLLYAGQDARLYLLDEAGQPACAIQAGGVVGVPIAADLGQDAGMDILVNDAGGHLLCLAPPRAGDLPQVRWRAPSIWNYQDQLYVNQGKAIPMVFDWNQDGKKEVLLGQPPRHLSLLNSDGQQQWTVELPFAPHYWNYGNFSGREAFDIFAAYAEGFYGSGCGVYAPGEVDEVVWKSNNGAFSTAVWDMDGDGRDDLVLRDLFWRHTRHGGTGRDIFPLRQWAGYHMPTIVVDEHLEHGLAVAWTGGNYSMLLDAPDGEQHWWLPYMSHWHPGTIGDIDGDGKLELGAPTWGQVYSWPVPMVPLPGLGRAFACLDLASSQVKWTYDPGASMSGVILADLDDDGLPEYLFGTGDGRLMALRGGDDEDRRLVFSVQLPAAVGTPIVCDPFGRGEMWIIVGCADGNLYALK